MKETENNFPGQGLSFDYVLKDDDYYRFNDFNAFETVHGRKGTRIRSALIPVILALALVIMAFSEVDLKIILVEAAVFIGLMLYFYANRRISYRKTLERAVERTRKKKGELYNPRGTMTFTEDAIVDNGKLTDFTLKYADVFAVYRNVNNLYVYANPQRVILVLSKMFDSDAEREEVWALLKDKIPAGKWMN